MELPNREGEARMDVLEGVERPAVGLIEQRIQTQPAGGDIGGGEGEDILA
jgi:hypothetical protein